MTIDIHVRVGDRNGPLLVPPVRLAEHPAVDHTEPVVLPQVDVDRNPVAIIPQRLGVEHERAVRSDADRISGEPGGGNDLVVSVDQTPVQPGDVLVGRGYQYLTQGSKTS